MSNSKKKKKIKLGYILNKGLSIAVQFKVWPLGQQHSVTWESLEMEIT